jgi:hypothetical protein
MKTNQNHHSQHRSKIHYSTKKNRDIELTTPVWISVAAYLNEVYKGDVTVHTFIIINNITAKFTLHLQCIFYEM